MRYWGILAAKLVVAAAFSFRRLVRHAQYLHPSCAYCYASIIRRFSRFELDPMVFLFFLSARAGILFLIVWDQRYRCRTCGRRLRMPVLTGRYAQMLLYGQPKLEYICTYGHGTLKVPELHIGGNAAERLAEERRRHLERAVLLRQTGEGITLPGRAVPQADTGSVLCRFNSFVSLASARHGACAFLDRHGRSKKECIA